MLGKLDCWAAENSVIAEEEAGFQKGKSFVDKYFVLHHLIQIYSQLSKKKLYVTIVDFSSAFDLIDRDHLNAINLKAPHSAQSPLSRGEGTSLGASAVVFAMKIVPQITSGAEIWTYTQELFQNLLMISPSCLQWHTHCTLKG